MDQKQQDNLILKSRVKTVELTLKDHEELIAKIKTVLPQLLVQTLIQIQEESRWQLTKSAKITYHREVSDSEILLLNVFLKSIPNEVIPSVWTSKEREKYCCSDISFARNYLWITVQNVSNGSCQIS
jgi:hypothetical protein